MVTVIIFDILVLITFLILGVPLSLAFSSALLFLSFFTRINMVSLILWGFNQILNPILLAIPLFILAGSIMSESGISKYLLNFVNSIVGRIKGGLGVVAIVTCGIIGAISGSSYTGLAATGPILIERMVEEKYPRGYASALITCSSILGLLIPPSGLLILYGWVTGTSILACFLATVIPGILIVISFSIINLLLARKWPLIMEPAMPLKQRSKKIIFSTWQAIPALSLPVIILGGIYGGVFSPAEAAGVSVIIALPIGFFIYRGLKMGNFVSAVKNAATSIGTIMIMVMFAFILGQTYVMLRLPVMIINFMEAITTNKYILLIFINIFLFFLGMLIPDSTGVVLTAPLLLPLVQQYGISPIHFAAIMGTNLAMGNVTPPFASLLYLGMRIGKVGLIEIYKPALIFLIFGYVPVVFLTTYWPELALFLPRLFGYTP